MDAQQLKAFCAALPGVSSYFPFGKEGECFRVDKRIFAQVFPTGVPGALTILVDETIPRERLCPMATLQCEPAQGDFYRRLFPKAVSRPYHTPPAQQPYALTLLLDGSVPRETVREMAGHAYTVTRAKLPKKVRDSLPPVQPAGQ